MPAPTARDAEVGAFIARPEREMKRRKSPARRAALATLGMLPLVGAFISIFWMLIVHARPETLGAAIAAWLLGCVTHLLGAIVLLARIHI